MDAEFDQHADTYRRDHQASIRLSGESTDYFARYKVLDTARVCREAGCDVREVIDFGSGVGASVGPLRMVFPSSTLTCADVSARSLEASRADHGDVATYVAYDGRTLPFEDGRFDLAFTACVFHHIPANEHVALLAELRRVLRPKGLLVLFEHNPWNPLTRHAVASCPFDENAVLISAPQMQKRFQDAGFAKVRSEFRIFFPHALKALRPMEKWLAAVPLGAQYLIAGQA